MPARNRRASRKKGRARGERVVRMIKYALLFLLVIGIFFITHKSYWRTNSRLAILFWGLGEGSRVVVLDTQNDQIASFYLPGSTEIDVANGLGVWKLKSIWGLGEQEGVGGGKLAVTTLTKSAHIPVFVYSEAPGFGLVSGSLRPTIEGIFANYTTNLSFGDRVSIALFSMAVKNTKRIDIDLTETSFLRGQRLIDGTSGFTISDTPPKSILSYFVSSEMDANPKVALIDNTGRVGFSEDLSVLMEVLGGKVLSITRNAPNDDGCTIDSKDKRVVLLFDNLLGCKRGKLIKEGSFDTIITIGRDFEI